MTTSQRRPRVVCVPIRPIEANVPIGQVIGSIGPSAQPTSSHRGVSTPTSQSIDRPVRSILDQSDRQPLSTRAPMNVTHHRVAASDVDFRFGPDGNSGAFDCYSTGRTPNNRARTPSSGSGETFFCSEHHFVLTGKH